MGSILYYTQVWVERLLDFVGVILSNVFMQKLPQTISQIKHSSKEKKKEKLT